MASQPKCTSGESSAQSHDPSIHLMSLFVLYFHHLTYESFINCEPEAVTIDLAKKRGDLPAIQAR
jgi:hypothetical protein